MGTGPKNRGPPVNSYFNNLLSNCLSTTIIEVAHSFWKKNVDQQNYFTHTMGKLQLFVICSWGEAVRKLKSSRHSREREREKWHVVAKTENPFNQ